MKEALKKLLTSLLMEKYPKIRDFHVSGDEFGYEVGVYLKYDDMSDLNRDQIIELKREIRDYAKYVLGSDKRVNNIYFYNPHNS
jgi:hypothetical protein